mmetsp:Transcript_13001/g.29667  ORF Transcript_13001/g.29667 Transcript_13001/m.29667 type:complete len:357 (+) Transcript_13001:327-1397(+)
MVFMILVVVLVGFITAVAGRRGKRPAGPFRRPHPLGVAVVVGRNIAPRFGAPDGTVVVPSLLTCGTGRGGVVDVPGLAGLAPTGGESELLEFRIGGEVGMSWSETFAAFPCFLPILLFFIVSSRGSVSGRAQVIKHDRAFGRHNEVVGRHLRRVIRGIRTAHAVGHVGALLGIVNVVHERVTPVQTQSSDICHVAVQILHFGIEAPPRDHELLGRYARGILPPEQPRRKELSHARFRDASSALVGKAVNDLVFGELVGGYGPVQGTILDEIFCRRLGGHGVLGRIERVHEEDCGRVAGRGGRVALEALQAGHEGREAGVELVDDFLVRPGLRLDDVPKARDDVGFTRRRAQRLALT